MESKSVLVFCPIKSWVEKLAESVAADFYQIGRPDPQDAEPGSVAARARLQTELSGARLAEVLEQLARCPAGLDKTLARVIRMGVAFHHAGLDNHNVTAVREPFDLVAQRCGLPKTCVPALTGGVLRGQKCVDVLVLNHPNWGTGRDTLLDSL